MSDGAQPYAERPLIAYLNAAASGEPTPGGGSVSALAGALGVTMATMSANFTFGKKKYAAVEAEMKQILAALGALRDRLVAATQRDTEAYAEVSAAYGMPKTSDDEKTARTAAIQHALQTAMEPPLEAMRAAREGMVATRRLLDIANPNLITDVGVAAIFLDAAARGAYLNVAINLKGLNDDELVEATRVECNSILDETARLAAEVASGVAPALVKKAK